MPKNIAFFSDGTGNEGGHGRDTNVFRLFQLARNDLSSTPDAELDPESFLACNAADQVAAYDKGVGTRGLDWIGKATGLGISANIRDGYDFITRWYEPGDRIYLFGFSRGAYTIRSLAGMIGKFGIPDTTLGGGGLRKDRARRRALFDEAYRIYRIGMPKTDAEVAANNARVAPDAKDDERALKAEAFRTTYSWDRHLPADDRAGRINVYMLGVWDTVRSLGLPIAQMEIELPFWRHRFHDHILSPYVRNAFHAVSIDDRRQKFHPVLWKVPQDPAATGQRFRQVWFPGVHADVGGGYAETGLSDGALAWMLKESGQAEHPLCLKDPAPFALDPHQRDPMHDSLDRFWKRFLYKEKPRRIPDGREEPEAELDPSFDSYMGLHYPGLYDPHYLGEHPAYRRYLRPPE